MKRISRAALLLPLLFMITACDEDPVDDDTEDFIAHMDATQEPGNIQSNASGVTYIEVDNDELDYQIVVSRISNITAAHIHGPAPAGVNAGILVTLFAGPQTGAVDGPLVIDEIQDGSAAFNVPLDSVLTLMRRGQAYVNVHTVQNPTGEIRGQIQVR